MATSCSQIRSFLPCPRSCGAPSTGGGRVEVCVQRVPWDLVGFSDFRLIPWVSVGIHVCLCGFRSGSSDLWFSSLAMVAALVHWFFGDLGQRLPHRLLPQALSFDKRCPARWRGEDDSPPSAHSSTCCRR